MKRLLGITMIAVLVLAGCGDDDDTDTDTDGTTGIANPASVYCVDQGGTVEIETAADGAQTSICVLADGTRIDEWEYFRQGTGITTTSG